MNKQKLISIVVIIVVYLMGLVSGSLITRNRRKYFFNRGKRPGKYTENIENRMVKGFSSRLGLSGEQEKKLKIIVNKYAPEMEKAKKTLWDQIKESKNNIEQDIRKVLTVEQLEKLDEFRKKRDSHSKLQGKRKGLRRQGMRFKEEPAAAK